VMLTCDGGAGRCMTDLSPPPPSPPPPPAPPPHVVADWGGYTPVPATATLPDARMCSGYSSSSYSTKTLAQCRASCDSTSGCAGFSWGIYTGFVGGVDRRRTLLAHDEPAVDGVYGSCYLMTSRPTSSSSSWGYTPAGCYAKGARLPPTWRLVPPGDVGSGATRSHW
jgi:hypothetical protein